MMISLGTAAVRAYQATRNATYAFTSLNSLSNWINYVSSDEDPKLKERLDRLSRRIDSLIGPLNFCLLWSHDKASVISDCCYQVRHTLERIEFWASKVSPLPNANREELLDTIDSYVHDLDFNTQALTLAISVINSSMSLQPIKPSTAKSNISVSSLIRASRRIETFFNHTGDITYSVGCLFSQDFSDTNEKLEWSLISAALKVHSNVLKKLYELHVEVLNDAVHVLSPDMNKKYELSSSLQIHLSSSLELGIVSNSSLPGLIDFAFVWFEKVLNKVSKRYAFVLQNLVENGSTRNVNGVRPLDLLYICRLCIYDNMNKSNGSIVVPPHVNLNDEELWVFLGDPFDPSIDKGISSTLWSEITSSSDRIMPSFAALSSALVSSSYDSKIDATDKVVSASISRSEESKENMNNSIHEDHFRTS